jgi:hypothetical protein
MSLPHKLATPNDQLTSRAGLLAIGQLMDSIQLAERVDKHFPKPKSNRGFMPSTYIQTLVLMQHQGHFHLDEVRHLSEDTALTDVLGLTTIPHASTLGAWLRKTGDSHECQLAREAVNKAVLQAALHRRKKVTLEIDATEVVANKADAHWTYNKNKGYMPMVGHIAETGQIVSCVFRQGNAAPAKENFEFIQQCQKALPQGCTVGALWIDAAGYQTRIIQYCDEQQIGYAIRAKRSSSIKQQLSQLSEADWQSLIKRNGEPSAYQSTHRMVHCIGDYDPAFDLVIQRHPIRQSVLDLDEDTDSQAHCAEGFICRAIATNRSALSDSEIIHWYNQRAEDSENRIKELKLDFGGDTLPCSDFNANALNFRIAALSYNLFALMRQLLPEDLASHRVTTIRWRVYGMAAKLIRTGRGVWLKLHDANKNLLEQVLAALRRFDPPLLQQKTTPDLCIIQ